MTRAGTIAAATGLCAIAGVTPTLAGQQNYVYSIVHPTYGDIGTLTETIDRGPETTRIDSRLRIAVKLLGIVVYRQESEAVEIMRGNRLVSLHCVTAQGGRRVEVHGEARGGRFVVHTATGSVVGPAAIVPSDPWDLTHTGEETVVFPDTGRILQMHISGGNDATVWVNGASHSARHFVAMSDTRQEVWLDADGVPIMFRTVESGTAIDFVLLKATMAAGVTTSTP